MEYTEDWLKRENKLLANKRKYIHFDYRISPEKSIKNISNPDFIIKRSFWPFIENEIVFPRYKKDTLTKERKIEPKPRKICYASHQDSQIYSYYNFLLLKKYESCLKELDLLDNVIAYRSIDKKCNIHFAYEIFEKIKNYNEVVALTFDIEKFFDTLDHKILLENWKKILSTDYLPLDHYKVYKSLTKFSTVKLDEIKKVFDLKSKNYWQKRRICSSEEFREKIRKSGIILTNQSNKGIPQGSPLSGLLSNIYMVEFDKLINDKIISLNGLYRRYSDDLIVLCPLKNLNEIKDLIIKSIQSLCQLEINISKTDVVIFKKDENGFIKAINESGKNSQLQYLGFNFDGSDILIRSSSISRYYRKMKKKIKRAVLQTKYSRFNKSKVLKRRLYRLYSHLGDRNFITYAYRASEINNSNKIKKQLSGHWGYLNKKIKEFKEKENIKS